MSRLSNHVNRSNFNILLSCWFFSISLYDQFELSINSLNGMSVNIVVILHVKVTHFAWVAPYKVGRRPCESHANPLDARCMEPVPVLTLGGSLPLPVNVFWLEWCCWCCFDNTCRTHMGSHIKRQNVWFVKKKIAKEQSPFTYRYLQRCQTVHLTEMERNKIFTLDNKAFLA